MCGCEKGRQYFAYLCYFEMDSIDLFFWFSVRETVLWVYGEGYVALYDLGYVLRAVDGRYSVLWYCASI